MKTIKVFITSSEELRLDRLEFADMIQQLNLILKPRGIEIDPLDNHEEYHRELLNCEICLVLYWTKFEDQTKDELDTAYSELCAGRNPQKIYVYFKETEDITPELTNFKESFSTKYGHFFCRYENVDTMRLNFLLQLGTYQNKILEALLKVHDSWVEIDGKRFVELKNVPFAGNNPEYLQLLEDIEEMNQMVSEYPKKEKLRQRLHDLQERRKAMENSLLDTAKLITRLSSTTTSARLAEAMRLFEAGDNKGANAILNFDEISYDADAHAARIDAAREIEAESVKALESNIEEYRLKIKTLQNTMESRWIDEVIAVYDKAVSVARNRITTEKFAKLLRDYANFLCKEMQYHLVGTLYDEALSIYRGLAIHNPEAFDSEVATTLNNLAGLHLKIQRFDEAEQEYGEALEIRRRLAEKNPEIFDSEVAETLNNLAILHRATQRFNLAEEEYNEALEIYRRLAKSNPEAYGLNVIITLSCIADMHYEKGHLNLAQKVYKEVAKYPNGINWLHDMALTISGLACFHSETKHFDVAEKEYNQVLMIFQCNVVVDPEAFEHYIALTLNQLANIHYNIQRFDTAEQEYCEALGIYRRYAEKWPDAYDRNIATILNNLGLLHTDTRHFEQAEKEYREALEIRRHLAENSPEKYETDVAMTLANLGVLHSKNQQSNLAIKELIAALEIYHHKTQYTHIDEEQMRNIESQIKELQIKQES